MPRGITEEARAGMANAKSKDEQHKAKSKKGGKAPKLARAPEVGPNERTLYLS